MKRNKIAGLALTYLAVALQIACREPSPDEVAGKIAASEELRHIDQICTEFPKPPKFREIKKGISGNSNVTIIYYQYVSDMSFNSVRDFYRDPSNRGENELIREDYQEPEGLMSLLTLRRQDVQIGLEHRPPSGIFSVDCIK